MPSLLIHQKKKRCICRKIIEYKLNPQKSEESENAETTTTCAEMTAVTCAETYLKKMIKSKWKEKVEEKKRDWDVKEPK